MNHLFLDAIATLLFSTTMVGNVVNPAFANNDVKIQTLVASSANDDAKIQALVASGGRNCKNKVAEQFDVPMSDIHVELGATLKQSIDAGEITLADILKSGLTFNWDVKKDKKELNGYCNTDAKGNVTEFKQ